MRPVDGNKLKELMEAKGWTTRDLGIKIRANASNVSRWCSGEQQPRPRKLKALARAFGVSVEELLVPEEVKK